MLESRLFDTEEMREKFGRFLRCGRNGNHRKISGKEEKKKKIDSPIPFRPVFPVGKEKENLKKNSHELLQVDPFVKLCQDDYWEVRACCPAVAVPVSCTCSLEKRKTVLADAYAELLLEIEPHVRCSAYVFLGAFICTFADPSITKLDYNENGKLIFVSQEGYEFR